MYAERKLDAVKEPGKNTWKPFVMVNKHRKPNAK